MVRVHREEIRSERKEDKRFESEDGAGVMYKQKGKEAQIQQWRYTSWRSPRRKSQRW